MKIIPAARLLSVHGNVLPFKFFATSQAGWAKRPDFIDLLRRPQLGDRLTTEGRLSGFVIPCSRPLLPFQGQFPMQVAFLTPECEVIGPTDCPQPKDYPFPSRRRSRY